MFSDNQSFFTDMSYPEPKEEQLPSRAFEVEDAKHRENYAFWLKPDQGVVELIDTTRTFKPLPQYGQKRRKDTFGPDEFPFGNESAEEYFRHMYQKSLDFEGSRNIVFLAWINPNTGEQIRSED